MILVGRYRSPFTRRVAISLLVLGFEYEHLPYTAWSHLESVRTVNPVGRVPALVLDSGETLFESAAILDYIDQLVGPARALVPATGSERRRVLRVDVCALACRLSGHPAFVATYPAAEVDQANPSLPDVPWQTELPVEGAR